MDYLDVHQTAANMLSPDGNGNVRLLDLGLFETLTDAEEMCHKVGGMLISRQAIAAIIISWKQTFPEARPYGE